VVLRGHENEVNAVAISPDKPLAVPGRYDHTARLWLLQMNDLVDLARAIVDGNFFY
jgi:WD40 repeat protein